MADCALKHQFPSLSSQQRWQHHHTYNIFWWKSVPDVCTSTQKSVIRRSQGWSRWLFTITFHKQHHVTTVVYAYLLQMMLRECATAISLFHIFLNIYPPVHPFYNVCIAVHGSFLSKPPPHQTHCVLKQSYKQQCLLYSKPRNFTLHLQDPALDHIT